MKEFEILERMANKLPRCGHCEEPLVCRKAERPKNVKCDLQMYEKGSAFNGCSVRCTLICPVHGEHYEHPLLHYGVLYNDVVDVFTAYKKEMNIPCGLCKGMCFPDHLFYCNICSSTTDYLKSTMCAKCSVRNHSGVGHFLVAVEYAEIQAFKQVLQEKCHEIDMNAFLQMTIAKMDGDLTRADRCKKIKSVAEQKTETQAELNLSSDSEDEILLSPATIQIIEPKL